jgi:hypothetical protein
LLACCGVHAPISALNSCAVRIAGSSLASSVALLVRTYGSVLDPVAASRILARIRAEVGGNGIAVVTLLTSLEDAVSAD